MAQKSRKTEDEGAGEESPLEALLAQHEGELNKINEEIEAVDKAEGAEIQAVQRKFHKQRLPILHKRNALLKKIPGVWLNICQNNPRLGMMLSQFDNEVLKHLEDLVVEEAEEGEDYKVIFHFGKNPFFKNSTITVDIKHSDDEGATVTSTPFEWLPGKNPKDKKAEKGKKREAEEDGLLAFIYSNDEQALVQICEIFKTDIYLHPFERADSDEEIELDDEDDEAGDVDDDEDGQD